MIWILGTVPYPTTPPPHPPSCFAPYSVYFPCFSLCWTVSDFFHVENSAVPIYIFLLYTLPFTLYAVQCPPYLSQYTVPYSPLPVYSALPLSMYSILYSALSFSILSEAGSCPSIVASFSFCFRQKASRILRPCTRT
jgi:hypothetical protein